MDDGAGASGTGPAEGCFFGAAGCFFGAGGVVAVAAARGAGAGGGAKRGAPNGGSGVMMLTGGIEDEVGKSALVALPVG